MLGGVPFHIETQIVASNAAGLTSSLPSDFLFNVGQSATKIHLLLSATDTRSAGEYIGQILLNYDSGNQSAVALYVGGNIRDWVATSNGTINTTTAPYVEEVYRGDPAPGHGWFLGTAVYDMMTLDVDPTRVLSSVRLSDTNGYLGFFIVGITIEHNPFAVVNGTVFQESWRGVVAGQVVQFEAVDDGGQVLATSSATLAADESFSATFTYEGACRVRAKASHWLSDLSPDVTLNSSGPTTIYFQLPNGDATGDNSVDLDDLNRVFIEFLSTDPSDTDLNGSGKVDLPDLNIVFLNFARTGE